MSKRIIRTEHAPVASGTASQAVVANGMIFVASQVAIDPRTEQLVLGDTRVQTKRVMENIRAVLQAAGSSLDKVVKTTAFLRNLNDFGAMNEVYWQYFQENPHACSMLQVGRLRHGAAVEIGVVALS
jgi:2-iminobutanoate/2-iminopropanoate deaminase